MNIIKNNNKINSFLSSNKYEIGKDMAPQNKNTSHIKTGPVDCIINKWIELGQKNLPKYLANKGMLLFN